MTARMHCNPDLEFHLKGCGLKVAKCNLEAPDLWREAGLLERLLYKNKNQHRTAHFFQHCSEVRRHLTLLRQLNVGRGLHRLIRALPQVETPSYKVPIGVGASSLDLPPASQCCPVLHLLLSGCVLLEQLLQGPLLCAAEALCVQLSMSYFMPLCLTALAMLARIRVLACQLLLDLISSYNALAEVLVVLPGLRACEAAFQLPGHVGCEFRAGAPWLVVGGSRGANAKGLLQLAAEAWEKFSISEVVSRDELEKQLEEGLSLGGHSESVQHGRGSNEGHARTAPLLLLQQPIQAQQRGPSPNEAAGSYPASRGRKRERMGSSAPAVGAAVQTLPVFVDRGRAAATHPLSLPPASTSTAPLPPTQMATNRGTTQGPQAPHVTLHPPMQEPPTQEPSSHRYQAVSILGLSTPTLPNPTSAPPPDSKPNVVTASTQEQLRAPVRSASPQLIGTAPVQYTAIAIPGLSFQLPTASNAAVIQPATRSTTATPPKMAAPWSAATSQQSSGPPQMAGPQVSAPTFTAPAETSVPKVIEEPPAAALFPPSSLALAAPPVCYTAIAIPGLSYTPPANTTALPPGTAAAAGSRKAAATRKPSTPSAAPQLAAPPAAAAAGPPPVAMSAAWAPAVVQAHKAMGGQPAPETQADSSPATSVQPSQPAAGFQFTATEAAAAAAAGAAKAAGLQAKAAEASVTNMPIPLPATKPDAKTAKGMGTAAATVSAGPAAVEAFIRVPGSHSTGSMADRSNSVAAPADDILAALIGKAAPPAAAGLGSQLVQGTGPTSAVVSSVSVATAARGSDAVEQVEAELPLLARLQAGKKRRHKAGAGVQSPAGGSGGILHIIQGGMGGKCRQQPPAANRPPLGRGSRGQGGGRG